MTADELDIPEDVLVEAVHKVWPDWQPPLVVPEYRTFARAVIQRLGLVRKDIAEYEKREAERKAYSVGFSDGSNGVLYRRDHVLAALPDPRVPPKPRTVTLDGVEWKKRGEWWYALNGPCTDACRHSWPTDCTTAEHYAAVAAYLTELEKER